MAPQSNDNKPLFQKDEKALCFHGEVLYDAKITDVKRTDPKETKSPFHYKVHYKGWKNTWDDWVPQDRLRKPTEDNRELAANLRHQATLKANPKMASKTRRGQGSEIGSGRGSEERTSSVPAAGGRGSKRARDNDLEKVGGDSPSHKRTRTRVNDARDSRHNEYPHIDMMSWVTGLPDDEPAREYASSLKQVPPPNLDVQVPIEAQSITTTICLVDSETLDQSTTMENLRQRQKESRDRHHRPDMPEKPAPGAKKASKKNKTQPSANTSTSSESDTESSEDESSSIDDASSGLSEKSSPEPDAVTPCIKDTKVVSGRGKINVGKKSDVGKERPRDSSSSECSPLSSVSSDIVNDQEDELLFDTESEDKCAVTEDNNKKSDKSEVTSVRRSVRTAAAVSTAKSKSMIKSMSTAIPKGNNETRVAESRSSVIPRTAKPTNTRPEPSRGLRNSRSSMASPRPQQALRPWKIKDTTNYTSADVDRLLALAAPKDEPEFFSQSSLREHPKMPKLALIGGTSYLEKHVIDEELRDARKRGKQYKLGSRGPKQQLPKQFEELPSDIDSDGEDHGAAPATSAPGEPFEVDPPGSNTPLDALKFPYRLIEKLNRDGDKFPPGWTEENLRSIPNRCLVWAREELLVKMPYSVLENRPPWVLKEVPDNAPFWDQFEWENEANIINAFVAKVKRPPVDDHRLRTLAAVAADRAFEAATQASRSADSIGCDASEAAAQTTRSTDTVFLDNSSKKACKKCIKLGVTCDGVKPICNNCNLQGRECDFSFPEPEDSCMRHGSIPDRQQESPSLSANNVEGALRARLPANRPITGLDILAFAAEVVESGTAPCI
ncbi:hypothetical protein AYO20_06344 [Fonsecaea nubica]|uniref:Chromatin modification-related protein EAF3 n=1 Tax=Fonsecaea nubica TaxID=856822 RepID=A0A178CZA6_9EURO|nr:hypothetical protein AYO20_06344 [Fonsecaea nubica]OAL34291.1 hypothetical protein AYO20_06344 [Fonsecaea nubica]